MRLLTAGSLVRVQLGEPKEKHTNRCAFSFAFKLIPTNNLVFRQADLRLLTASQACARSARWSKPRRGRNKENFRGASDRLKGDILRAKRVTRFWRSQVLMFLTVRVVGFVHDFRRNSWEIKGFCYLYVWNLSWQFLTPYSGFDWLELITFYYIHIF